MKYPRMLKKLIGMILIITALVISVDFFFRFFNLPSYKELLLTLIFVAVITVADYGFFMLFNRKYNWETQAKKKTILGFVGLMLTTVIAYGICRFVYFVVIAKTETAGQFFQNENPGAYVIVLLIAAIVSLIMYLIGFYKTLRETKLKEQKMIADTTLAKYEALQNQLSPHFLFNNLNVLTALIDENPESAQKFTAKLAKVYRYVLEQKSENVVPLTLELNFTRNYVDLLKTRYESALQCELPEDKAVATIQIIPLGLQMLIENAIKHNNISDDNPLKISVELEEDCIAVKNDLQSKTHFNNKVGRGLENIKSRYALLTDKTVIIEKTASAFCVKLPFLNSENG